MERKHYLAKIDLQLSIHPVCAILGARQVGKTTLAQEYAAYAFNNDVHFFDLENPLALQELENPMLALSNVAERLIVIDEIQRRPDLFPILRVLVDRFKEKKKFLILGSASRDLIRQSSETLAGRIGYIELTPFTVFETHDIKKLWLRGGFPLSYLAVNDEKSYLWRQNYITTFLERDIPNLGFDIPAPQLHRCWLMLAHYHGQTFNASELARSLGVSDHTVRKYVDILASTFMIRSLTPWFENIQKRQVKSPKIYFRDSGIFNALLGIENEAQLFHSNPRLGAFWEGFALEEINCVFQTRPEEAYFWATQGNAELDLLIVKDGKRIGFEFKYGDAPSTTKSMHIALQDLQLDHLGVIYPGDRIFPMTETITAYGFDTVASGEFTKRMLDLKLMRAR